MSDGELVQLIERQSDVISTQAQTIDKLFKLLAQHIAADEIESLRKEKKR